MVTAIDIKTDLWNNVIDLLLKDHWAITHKYGNFDAGIDFDFVILEKHSEEILFGWDNWLGGEIQCSASRMKDIGRLAGCELKKREAVNLKPEIVQ